MKAANSSSVALLLTLSSVFVGCGGGDAELPPVLLSDSESSADVDPSAGTIVLPVERYLLSNAEIHRLGTARLQLLGECAAASGVRQSFVPVEFVPETDRRYGVWVAEEVAVHGYGLATELESTGSAAGAEPIVGDAESDVELANEDLEVIEECARDEAVSRLDFETIRPGFAFAEVFGTVTDDVLASAQGKLVFEDWEKCLAQNGLERDITVSPFAIRGASLEPTEQNIRIALADVGCKSDVRFVERLAALEAERQAPLVAEYRNELIEVRAAYDEMLANAGEILASSS